MTDQPRHHPPFVENNERRSPSTWDRLIQRACAPVDAASLGVFRMAFGLVIAWWAIDDLRLGRVRELYVAPKFHFSYYGFEFVRPWPESGPYLHYLIMVVLAILVAAGLWYRMAMPLLASCFAITFLWDRTNYQNHYFLLLLLSMAMSFLPLNRAFALDRFEQRNPALPIIPGAVLWLIRFHVALPYIFGGFAKLDRDWIAGAAMREFLAVHVKTPIVGSWLATPAAPVVMAWAGFVFDLSLVPLLMWRRTRTIAFLVAVVFHLSNHFLFSIHIFPWFMILATTVFFDPDWPRRLLRMQPVSLPVKPRCEWNDLSIGRRFQVITTLAYVGLLVVLPLRHYGYGGETGWHERGHYFAWRMMLRSKLAVVRYYLTDPETGETWHPQLRRILCMNQLTTFGRDPEMVLDLAHHLAAEYRQATGTTAEVRALVLAKYNGRKPQLLIDPTVDLVREPRGFYARSWIRPQNEPLPAEPRGLPVEEWEAMVDIPPMPQPTRGPRGERLRPPQPSRTVAVKATVSP